MRLGTPSLEDAATAMRLRSWKKRSVSLPRDVRLRAGAFAAKKSQHGQGAGNYLWKASETYDGQLNLLFRK